MTPDAQFETQYETFLNFVDEQGPAKAATNLRRVGLSDDVLERLVERFENHRGQIQEQVSPGYMSEGRRWTWYTGPRPTDRCWPPLERLLREQWDDDDNVNNLDASSTGIVGLLDHPKTKGFQTKGMVLGHVQSGKTSNYTAVMAKAADRGFRLFIVLSGIHNELRRQTQNRLVEHLVDLNNDYWIPLTKPDHDFVPPANAAAYFSKYSEQPVLCVVKKNAAVLRKLIRWLGDASLQLRNCPAIVIDDEADQATVATKTINPLVRELLDALPRAAYIGYTATPFANLLIDPSAGDLYPRDFIFDLPPPTNHFGTEVIFGREPQDHEDPEDVFDGYDMIRLVPDEEVGAVRPASRADAPDFVPVVQGQLRRAVFWFWLATAARRVRGTGTPHSTMLVHTSVSVAVHQAFKGPLEHLRQTTASKLESADRRLIEELRGIWQQEVEAVAASDFGETTVGFTNLLEGLSRTVEQTRVILDNSMSEERLEYGDEAVTAIAVGGNTLSRGLTLEGLVVSYFVRSVSAYDTLLQMGRWFGYREGYADLPRIWMSDELRQWFRHLAGVEADLRADVQRYVTDGTTPLQFAARIQAHPSLAITSAAKMRDAVQVGAAYGGMRVQTRYFHADDQSWLLQNQQAARNLVAAAVQAGPPADPRPGVTWWAGVPASAILEFLKEYSFHERAMDSEQKMIAEYILDRNGKEALESWNVAIVGNPPSSQQPFDFGSGVKASKIVRAKLKDSPSNAADIKTLMSRRDAAIDLSIPNVNTLTEGLIKKLRCEQRPVEALAVLYPIDRVSNSNRESRVPLDAEEDVVGVGFVFPEPPPGEDSKVYFAADLSKVPASDGYFEEEDLAPLEDEE